MSVARFLESKKSVRVWLTEPRSRARVTHLQGLFSAKGFLILHKATPLIRLAVAGIPARRSGAKLAGFKNHNLLVGPGFEAMLCD